MAHDVHIHLAFSCSAYDGPARFAERHVTARPNDEQWNAREALWFLCDVASRRGVLPGTKGGVLTWGMVGNHTSAAAFVEDLREFWIDLFWDDGEDGGPHDHAHILVFYEDQDSEQAHCYEVSCDRSAPGRRDPGGRVVDRADIKLVVRHHALPFAWMQY